MNAKRRDDGDLDTSTGLPRKAVSKLFLVLLMLLQILVTGIVTRGLQKQDKLSDKQDKLSEELAELRIEVAKLQVSIRIPPIVWGPPPIPASSVANGPVKPSNTP